MRLNQIVNFLKVAEMLSVSKAADSLNIAQSALSRHLRELEAQVGVALIERSGRGIALTPAGERFRDFAKEAMRNLRSGVEEARHVAKVGDDVVAGLPPSLNAIVADEFGYGATNETHVRLVEGWSEFLTDWVLAGRLDFAVAYDRVLAERRLSSAPLCRERYYFVQSGTNAADHRQLSTTDLAGTPLVLPSKGHGLRDVLDRAFASAGVQPDVRVELDSLSAIKHAVTAHGIGTILPGGEVLHDAASGHLSAVPIRTSELTRMLYFVWLVAAKPAPEAVATMQRIRVLAKADHFSFVAPDEISVRH